MKALFIGLGSIGQRHLRNLKILIPDIKVSAYRTSKNVPFLNSENQPCEELNLSEFYNIREFTSLEEALKQKPDMVFVTNPSKYHAPSVIAALRSGAYVFVEKPLSSDLKSAQEILNIEKQLKKKMCMVGFQYRYHPALIKLKELIDKDIIGKIINGQVVNGEYLPNWHPYEDYRKSYASLKKLGGGAILTQIHDFDYSIFLFGMPKSVFTMGGKLSSLDIDVEDSVNISALFCYKESQLILNINLDYISWPSRRYIKLFGEDGTINCDLKNNYLEVIKRSTNKIQKYNFNKIQRNDLFMKELKNFYAFVQGNEKPLINLEEGIKSLQFAMAAKCSLKEKKILHIEDFLNGN